MACWRDSGQSVANDEVSSNTAELLRNGEPIQWAEYWLSKQEITPHEASKLSHCIDPIKWPGDQCKQGPIHNDLRIKIRWLEKKLAVHKQKWTLVDLVEALGKDVAPHGMKQAVWAASADKAPAKQVEEMQTADC